MRGVGDKAGEESGTRGTGWEKRRNMAWVRGGGRIISDRARLAEFSSMFHPPLPSHPPLYTRSMHARSLTLSRPQFVRINATPFVRRRGVGTKAEEANEKPGKFFTRRCVPSSKGNFRDNAITPPPDSPIFFFLSRFLWTGGKGDEDQQRGLSTGEDLVSNRAEELLIFLRGRYSLVALEERL